MFGWIPETLSSLVIDVVTLVFWRHKCPTCKSRLKHISKQANSILLECATCEKEWLKDKGGFRLLDGN